MGMCLYICVTNANVAIFGDLTLFLSFWNSKYSLALTTADTESDSLSGVSLIVADAKLVCDARLSDRLNVSRKLRSDDNEVDFFGELFTALTSSSLSARTYKLPIFSLILKERSQAQSH